MELTPWRIRMGIGILAGVVGVLVVTLIGGVAFRGETAKFTHGDENLVEKINALQEEMRQKDLALSVQEKRIKEMQELPTLAAAQPRPSRDVQEPPEKSEPLTEEGGPLLSMPEPGTAESSPAGPSRKPADGELAEDGSRTKKGNEAESLDTPETRGSSAKLPVIAFNAQRVTAVAETPNTGTLSFQLVKDNPDIRFSGYLFVFVEMVDGQENKIYAYPKRARLGEEDLPTDFREGESVSFKYNSRVELPYGDVRSGAALSRVSILLYGQNGKIVFQRGFDRREVKLMHTKTGTAEGRPAQGEKRRAL
jgi:hypothetical protein